MDAGDRALGLGCRALGGRRSPRADHHAAAHHQRGVPQVPQHRPAEPPARREQVPRLVGSSPGRDRLRLVPSGARSGARGQQLPRQRERARAVPEVSPRPRRLRRRVLSPFAMLPAFRSTYREGRMSHRASWSRLVAVSFAVVLLAGLGAAQKLAAYPGGTPRVVTNFSTGCTNCHSSVNAEQLRDVPPDAQASLLIEGRHFAEITAGEENYSKLA